MIYATDWRPFCIYSTKTTTLLCKNSVQGTQGITLSLHNKDLFLFRITPRNEDKKICPFGKQNNFFFRWGMSVHFVFNVFCTYLGFFKNLTPWLMEPRGSMPHSQGPSNNFYPEPNLPNSSC